MESSTPTISMEAFPISERPHGSLMSNYMNIKIKVINHAIAKHLEKSQFLSFTELKAFKHHVILLMSDIIYGTHYVKIFSGNCWT